MMTEHHDEYMLNVISYDNNKHFNEETELLRGILHRARHAKLQ
jgi:hypothetical protein